MKKGTRDMGKSKKLCKKMFATALDVQELSTHILSEWEPSKEFGLNKKESLAAYVGFALGLYHGAESVLRGVPIHDSGNLSVYDWLCTNVQQYRDDREGYMQKYHEDHDCYCFNGDDDDDDDKADVGDLLALVALLDMLSGHGDHDEEE